LRVKEASLAQLVEHRSRKAGVISSSLIAGSIECMQPGDAISSGCFGLPV
jgi:hypothetical protein